MKKQNLLFNIILVALFAICFSNCETDVKTKSTTVVKEEIPKNPRSVPRFIADSAYAYTAKQVAFGPRVPNMESHKACKEWLSAKLKSFGASVIEQDFQAKAYTGTVLNGTNIMGQFNPDKKKRVLLAAHWDTRHIADKDEDEALKNKPIDGADDGASGVGVLLEIARQIQANGIDMGVDIMFFDAEDHGDDSGQSAESWCLGSQHWARNIVPSGYTAKYGILLDMVGSKDAHFPQEGYSMQIHPQLVDKIWKLGKRMGHGQYFKESAGGQITDDHYFVSAFAKIPMIDIINLPIGQKTFGFYHHTHDDNMDVIDTKTLNAVGQTMLAVIYRENNGTF